MDKEWLRHMRFQNKPRSARPLSDLEKKYKKEPSLYSRFGDWALKYQYYYPKKWKRDAVEITEKAAGEYYDEAQRIIKKRGGYGNLGFIDRLKVDGNRALSGFNYYVSSVAEYLGPETGSEYISTIATLPAGIGKTVATKVPKAGKMVMDGIHAYKAGKLVKKVAKKELERIKNSHRPNYTPLPHRKNFTQHPLSQIGVSPYKKSAYRRARTRQTTPSFSYLDPVKVADWSLQTHRDPVRKPTPPSDPFMPVTKRLQQIENRAQNRIREQNRINSLMNKFEKSISRPHPVNAHQQMRQKYGAKIDAIAQKSTFPDPSLPVRMSKQEFNSLQQRLNHRNQHDPSSRSSTQFSSQHRGNLRSMSQNLTQQGAFSSQTIPQRSRPSSPQLGSLQSMTQGLHKR
jgi:hypothetical protein